MSMPYDGPEIYDPPIHIRKRENIMSYIRYLWLKFNLDQTILVYKDIRHKDLNRLNDSVDDLIKIGKKPHKSLHQFINTILGALLLTLIPTITIAYTSGEYRDKYGGYAGSWEGDGHQRIYKDAYGDYAGSAERDGDGWTFKDDEGGYAGSSTGDSDRNPFVGNDDD